MCLSDGIGTFTQPLAKVVFAIELKSLQRR
jgi:hypothetical protein